MKIKLYATALPLLPVLLRATSGEIGWLRVVVAAVTGAVIAGVSCAIRVKKRNDDDFGGDCDDC